MFHIVTLLCFLVFCFATVFFLFDSIKNVKCEKKQQQKCELWDNRNNRQSMTIGDQSMPMFQDENIHRIHRDRSSTGHPCSTIQGSARYLSLMRPAIVLLPHWTNNHYPMPGLTVVINKFALLPTPSIDKAFQ